MDFFRSFFGHRPTLLNDRKKLHQFSHTVRKHRLRLGGSLEACAELVGREIFVLIFANFLALTFCTKLN